MFRRGHHACFIGFRLWQGASFPARSEIVCYGDDMRFVYRETGFVTHKFICVSQTILKAPAFSQRCSRVQETPES